MGNNKSSQSSQKGPVAAGLSTVEKNTHATRDDNLSNDNTDNTQPILMRCSPEFCAGAPLEVCWNKDGDHSDYEIHENVMGV